MDESTQGRSHPIGATLEQGGANFCLFTRTATAVDLLLFDGMNDPRPSRVVRLDPLTNRTYHYWHGFVPGVEAGQVYGYRVHGPWDPSRGLYFDPSRVITRSLWKGCGDSGGFRSHEKCRRRPRSLRLAG